MKLNSVRFLLLVMLMVTSPLTVRPQQPSFTVASIRPYNKAVPGQIMEVLIEGLTSGPQPIVLPETDFEIEVIQDGVSQKAKVRITKFTMTTEANPQTSNNNTIDVAGMKMRVYQGVTFVVPKGLHAGPADVVVKYKGKRGNAVSMDHDRKFRRRQIQHSSHAIVRAAAATVISRSSKIERGLRDEAPSQLFPCPANLHRCTLSCSHGGKCFHGSRDTPRVHKNSSFPQ
jgi:hypothetical protein